MNAIREVSATDLEIPSRFNLTTALIDAQVERGHGSRPAIECGDRVWTYSEIAELTNRAGSGLRALGVGREDRVLIVLPDSPEFVAAFLGAIKIGAIAVPCSTFLKAADYRYFLQTARARIVITNEELLARMGSGLEDLTPSVVVVDSAEDRGRVLAWRSWIDLASPDLVPADTHKDEMAFWLWTSGSTGEPKAAVHLHQDAPWCCHLYGRGVLEIGAADRTFSAAKLFHAYGLGNALFFPFWAGATTILLPVRATPQAVYMTIHRTRPTIFFGVPTLFATMLDVADAETRFDLSSLRFSISAGEPLPADLYLAWRARFGTEILDGLGSTEVLQMYVASRPGRVKPGSSGYPVPGYDVRVVSESGESVGPNEVGDLIVKGPSTALMYWNRREQTKQKMRGEWFVSGDKYTVDDDGCYWYAGRSDDMFKVAGEWVSPMEIERILSQHSAVLECAVVPLTDASGVLKPKACVVLKDGRGGDAGLVVELQAFVRERAAHYKCPRIIEFLSELPRTATGKVQRFRLR